jgi:hypothetical protein
LGTVGRGFKSSRPDHFSHVEVPEGWSQVATDVLAQKYFRKAGVPRG